MSPEFRRRIQVATKRVPAVASILVLGILLVASLCAEWITNSKPIICQVQGKILIPAYLDYNRPDVGLAGAGTVDYREIRDEMEWSLWPLLNWDPYENDLELLEVMSAPSSSHLMGTDVAGRDVFARLLYGTRISFFFAWSVWILTYVSGTVFGMIQGFWGGKVDLFGQRIVEIFASTPEFYLLLLLVTIMSPSVFMLIPLSAAFGWVSISQYMRAEALRNRSLTYCEAAASLGASRRRILFAHILPNSLVPLITFSPFSVVGGIIGLASLDLLGFGVPAPTPSWGELLGQARNNFQVAWWLAFFPSAFLFISIVSLNLIGEALRAAFDPRVSV